MQGENTDDLLSKIATLMLRFDQRFQEIEQQQVTVLRELHSFTQQVPPIVRQAASEVLQPLPKHVQDHVNNGLKQTITEYQQHYQTAGHHVQASAHHIDGQLDRMARVNRLLLWKLAGTTIACLALLLIGGIWLSTHYASVIRENQISAETLTLYNNADLVRCDHQLCAKVDIKGKRYGEHGEYMPIKAR